MTASSSDDSVPTVQPLTAAQADKLREVVTDTYGDNGMSRALVAYIESLFAAGSDGRLGSRRGVPHELMLVCWDWFSGGTTAEGVARRICEVLDA